MRQGFKKNPLLFLQYSNKKGPEPISPAPQNSAHTLESSLKLFAYYYALQFLRMMLVYQYK